MSKTRLALLVTAVAVLLVVSMVSGSVAVAGSGTSVDTNDELSWGRKCLEDEDCGSTSYCYRGRCRVIPGGEPA